LHMAQLMPLPLTVSCFSKIQIGFTFLVPAYPGRPAHRAVKRVCVCACVRACVCVGMPLQCYTLTGNQSMTPELKSFLALLTPTNEKKVVQPISQHSNASTEDKYVKH